MLTTITLALIDVAQGAAGAVILGLDHIRRDLTRRERKTEQARRMVESVHRDLERLPNA